MLSNTTIKGTDNIWPAYSKGNTMTGNKGASYTDTLGKDQFMKILIAQLRNQDPMKPMEDKEFIAQMAQFSSVEHLMNISNEMSLLRQSMGIASGLIGKTVSWWEMDATFASNVRTGVVEAITFKNNAQYVYVEGEEIPLDYLIRVEDKVEQP